MGEKKLLDWDFISTNVENLSDNFIDQNQELLNWEILLFSKEHISDEFLDKYNDRITPNLLLKLLMKVDEVDFKDAFRYFKQKLSN